MARDLTGGIITEITSSKIEGVLFLKLEFDSPNELFFWTGIGDQIFNGDTYNGVGDLLSIEDVEETALLKAAGVTFQLSGISSEILALALDENYQERIATLYFGAFDSNKDLISDTFQLFSGRMDTMTIESNGEQLTIALAVENRLIDLERPKIRRYTTEEQKELFPGDLGLDFVTSLNDGKVLVWGRG